MTSPTLSDGSVACPDYTISIVFESVEKLEAVQEAIESLTGEGTVNRGTIDEDLPDGEALTVREAEALFAGLNEAGAACERDPASQYADYAFEIDVSRAVQVLDQQIVARLALDSQRDDEQSTDVRLVATLPEIVDKVFPHDELISFEPQIRDLLLGAKEEVRIANPYFDPHEEVLKDIASLPQRGVKTQILTRETNNPSDSLRTSLNTLYDSLDDDNRQNVEVRDLYAVNPDTDLQEFATHAKLVIVDDDLCYVGSANLTGHSISRNFELGALLSGPPVGSASRVFDVVFENSTPVTLPLD